MDYMNRKKIKSKTNNQNFEQSIFDLSSEDEEQSEKYSKKLTNCSLKHLSNSQSDSEEGCNLSESSSDENKTDSESHKSSLSDNSLADKNSDSDTDCNGDPMEPSTKSEYYDFTNILNTQALIKDLNAQRSSDKSTTSYSCEKVNTPIKSKKKKVKEKSDNSILPTGPLHVTELLAIGENCDMPTDLQLQPYSSKNEDDPNKKSINIIIPQIKPRRKKVDVNAMLNRHLNSVIRKNQEFYHKVHLLFLIAHGNFLNSVLNNQDVLGPALSVIPSDKFYPPKHASLEYLEKLVSWFSKKFVYEPQKKYSDDILIRLTEELEKKKAFSINDLVLLFICVARVLGLKCRLIMSLQPMPLKPKQDQLIRTVTSKNKNSGSDSASDEEWADVDSKLPQDPELRNDIALLKRSQNKNEQFKVPGNKQRKNSKVITVNSVKNEKKHEVGRQTSKSSKGNKSKQIGVKRNRKVLSSDSEDNSLQSKKSRKGVDVWAEVFLESEEKWISVDVHRGKVHCVDEIYSYCTHPVLYVLGWNNDLTIKDLTRRYCPQWMTTARKFRVSNEWWNETLHSWNPKLTAQEKEENLELDRILSEKPLPVSIGEYKNHPLYVLKRHLLKFEAIYPPNAPPIGYVRKEPVYSRLCVQTLHAKEAWMRQAKVVRLDENPYKIVKARPKYDKLTGKKISDLPLNLFGQWQVEDYIPPIAVDGQVPKNEYGNVELYKPSMLPVGTVHLQIPGLMRVAKKLGIDCAPAVVGWEHSGGSSHPVFDGFIVCEEFKDKVLDYWNKEIDETAKRERQKSQQAIYDNWRRLIKGLIIRERLQKRYNFSFETNVKTTNKRKHRTRDK